MMALLSSKRVNHSSFFPFPPFPLFLFSFARRAKKRETSSIKQANNEKKAPISLVPARVVFSPSADLESRSGLCRCDAKVEVIEGLLSGVEVALGLGFGIRCCCCCCGRWLSQGRRRRRGGVDVRFHSLSFGQRRSTNRLWKKIGDDDDDKNHQFFARKKKTSKIRESRKKSKLLPILPPFSQSRAHTQVHYTLSSSFPDWNLIHSKD